MCGRGQAGKPIGRRVAGQPRRTERDYLNNNWYSYHSPLPSLTQAQVRHGEVQQETVPLDCLVCRSAHKRELFITLEELLLILSSLLWAQTFFEFEFNNISTWQLWWWWWYFHKQQWGPLKGWHYILVHINCPVVLSNYC